MSAEPNNNVVDLGKRWAQELREQGAPPVSGSYDDSWMVDNPDVLEAPPATDEEPPADTSRRLDWTALAGQEPPEREWLIPHWLTHGVTLLAGSGGAGKSYVTQGMASALALGEFYVGQPTAARRVLIWNCEDDEHEIWRRQAALAKHFGVDLAEFAGKLHVSSRVGLNNALLVNAYGRPTWTATYETLKQEVADTEADVLFLDNLGHLYGCNENNRGEVTQFVAGLYALAPKDKPLAIVLAGHPAKSQGSEFSGSTAWENAVRMRWFLGSRLPDQKPDDDERDVDETIRYLCKRKANYTAADFARLRWVDNAIIPDQALGAEVFKASSAFRQEAARNLILAALRKFNDANLRCVAGHTSKDNYLIGRMLRQKLGEDLTKAELTRALEQLMLEGQIVERDFGKGADRHPVKGLFVNF